MARAGVVGLGLIGGSIGLGLKRSGCEVWGLDPDPATRETALRRGAVDDLQQDLEALSRSVHVLFLAAPPLACLEILERLERHPGMVVTDTASVKSRIAARGRERLSAAFIPGHPMAGSEGRGIEAARGDLFEGATWYLCAPARATPLSLLTMIDALGAAPQEIDPETHDRLAAWTSHLPQLLAWLVTGAWKEAGVDAARGGGVAHELARIARSPSELWTEIAWENRGPLREALRGLGPRFEQLSQALDAESPESLRRVIEEGAP